MSQILFERYKETLRRGHLAAQQGRLADAIRAYEAAASLAPDRALPHVSLGQVLLRLGRLDDAELAFSAALRRTPTDEPALRGRATVRVALRRSQEAAADREVLAEVLERDGRLVEACDEALAALELAESRTRRRTLERVVAQLRLVEGEPRAAEAVTRAQRVMEPPAEGLGGGSEAGAAPPGPPLPAQPEAPAEPPAPFDPVSAMASAWALLDTGDRVAAYDLLLAASAAQRSSGRLDAALDAALSLVALDPADPAVQLEIAANQAARGWTDLATEKVRLLARLAELDEDATAAASIREFSAAHGLSPVDTPVDHGAIPPA
ncbi:MAG: tetratricopeptide repeat protein [Candidatus Limnocylindrales bacterium]